MAEQENTAEPRRLLGRLTIEFPADAPGTWRVQVQGAPPSETLIAALGVMKLRAELKIIAIMDQTAQAEARSRIVGIDGTPFRG